MDVLEAIHSRMTIGQVKPDPVPTALVEKILSAAVQAPNHYKVRPWRFVVVTGAGREKVGELFSRALRQRDSNAPEALIASQKDKAMRSPVMIVVGVDKPAEQKVLEIENVCATAAAVQNLLLAAHALGLAAKWNTGAHASDPTVKDYFGFAPDQHLIGFIHLGYPLTDLSSQVNRPSFEDRTVWLNS